MKIITVVGARPQFIKAAAVSREISKYNGVEEKIIHTGQHFDPNMSDIFFSEMKIPKPHYYLDVHSMSHGAMTGKMLEKIEAVLLEEKPECVLVYGDTNSTLAGALASTKLHIPVAHVEAGLRSFNMKMPEEVNRILTDRISNILFCPTENAVRNLHNEGYNNFNCKIMMSGDVMQDAAMFYSQYSSDHSNIIANLKVDKFVVCTLHRAENTDDRNNLYSIFDALKDISKDINVVVPLHPRTRKRLKEENINTENIIIIEPVGYLDMIELLKNSSLILTDSGGLQKEAYFFDKPCVTLRHETEWVELVDNGYNIVAGSSRSSIIDAYKKMIKKDLRNKKELYGSGRACSKIVEMLLNSYI